MARVHDRFDGAIAGVGSASGVRVVLGMWAASPFGAVTDAMVERPDGHRVLLAPSAALADYVAATYTFDEVRVEPVTLTVDGPRRTVRSASLQVTVTAGRRTVVGLLLRAVPRRLATSRWWVRAVDLPARLLRHGVRTVGTAGGGRTEYYAARDEHRLRAVSGRFDGVDLGPLRAVRPPVRFGFGSTPPRPALVTVTTLVDRPG